MKENKVDRAIALTETAINACKDLVTSKGKVLRMPGKAPYTKTQIAVYATILGSLLIIITSIIWNVYYKNKNKRKKKEIRMFKKIGKY